MRAFRLTTYHHHKSQTGSVCVVYLAYTCVKLQIRHELCLYRSWAGLCSASKLYFSPNWISPASHFCWVGTQIKQTMRNCKNKQSYFHSQKIKGSVQGPQSLSNPAAQTGHIKVIKAEFNLEYSHYIMDYMHKTTLTKITGQVVLCYCRQISSDIWCQKSDNAKKQKSHLAGVSQVYSVYNVNRMYSSCLCLFQRPASTQWSLKAWEDNTHLWPVQHSLRSVWRWLLISTDNALTLSLFPVFPSVMVTFMATQLQAKTPGLYFYLPPSQQHHIPCLGWPV